MYVYYVNFFKLQQCNDSWQHYSKKLIYTLIRQREEKPTIIEKQSLMTRITQLCDYVATASIQKQKKETFISFAYFLINFYEKSNAAIGSVHLHDLHKSNNLK